MSARAWFRVHSFTGVITGLMLFVICWSGSFAVIAHELDWLADPGLRVEPGETPADWAQLHSAVEQAYPEADIVMLTAPLYTRSAARALVNLPRQESVWLYIDPYTARVQGSHSYLTIQPFLRNFHYRLFVSDIAGAPAGLYLVSVFSITLLISLVAALVFYKRWWRRLYRWPRGTGRKFWSEMHRTTGVLSIWFLIIIGITGVWYLYEAVQPGPVNYVGPPPHGEVAPPVPEPDPAARLLPLDSLLEAATTAWPELEVGTIARGWYSAHEHTLYLEGQADFPLVRDRANQMHLNPYTGEVLWRNSAADLPLYWLWSNMADPLHFGNFAGLWSKIIWFLFGLALCAIILTGTYLHAQRLAREAGGRARHRWPGTGAAIVVSLLVLAASVPFGFQEAREFYGPTVDGARQLPALAPGVKAVIIGWVAATLAIIVGWVWMLWRHHLAASAKRSLG